MIQAVVFDCFGVLAYDGWLAFKEKYFDSDPDKLERAIELNRMSDAGLLSYADFVQGIASLAQISDSVARKILEDNPPNEKLFTYIRDDLKPKYKIGMLSNASDNWLHDIFEPWQVELFDETVLSYQVGAIKPYPLMYQTIATKLGMLPDECIFVDDQQRFVDGAGEIGMQAFTFVDTQTTIDTIKGLLRA